MNILWLIIKIILWIVVGLIVIVLIGLGVILCSPVRYEAYLSKEEQLTYDIRWSYLLGVKGLFYQDFDKKNHWIKIFGKTFYKQEIQFEEMETGESVKCHQKSQVAQMTKSNEKVSNTPFTKQEHFKEVEKKEKIHPTLKKETEEELKDLGENIKQETEETTRQMSFGWVKEILFDKRMYGAIKEMVLCIWRILKGIAPDEWDFEVVVGKEEPADTGELIAKLTMLYPIYYQHGIIRGNYEKECLEGGFLIKGKFTLGMIVVHILRCILSQPVWWLIKMIVNLRKEEENGK